MLERTRQLELMDDPLLDSREHARALDGLARLNAISGSANLIWRPIRRLHDELARPLKVLDLACGRGDISLSLGELANSSGRQIHIDGSDISPRAVDFATRQAEARGAKQRFFVLDALNDQLPQDYDVIMTSLFLHHLDESDAIALMRKMALSTKQLVIVNDLTRSPLSLVLVDFACRLVGRSRVVQFDGPASVRNAFTPGELLKLAAEASLLGGRVKEQFPCLMLYSWRKAEHDRQS